MAFPYGRHENYSPLGGGQTIYHSPGMIQETWQGDMGSPPMDNGMNVPGIPMHPRPQHRESNQSLASQSSLFPKPGQSYGSQSTETESFLFDPINKLDTHTFSSTEYQPYKDNTARQLGHLLLGSSLRWLITVALCASYVVAVKIWMHKSRNGDAISENYKRLFNAITTAISLALGLNVASAFKDLALYMRWPILSYRKRSLRELDLILNADSLSKLCHLVFITRRPWVIICCLAWLFINILAQAGIAMVNLTYGFDVNNNAVILKEGNVTIPNMAHFYPSGQALDHMNIFDEQYTAHVYGALSVDYGIDNISSQPKTGDINSGDHAMLWYDVDTSYMEMIFIDSSTSSGNTVDTQFAVYSERKINITYACEAHKVTSRGNGSFNTFPVAEVGNVAVHTVLSNSSVFFTNSDNYCEPGNLRCSIVEVFEVSETDPWYYKCNVTLGHTTNDGRNLSYISDDMAFIATSSIAQIGYANAWDQESYIYPTNSFWGSPLGGDKDTMGFRIATYALGSIAGASLFNPKLSYEGMAPTQGFALNLGHAFFFYFILGLICLCHLIFVVVVAIFANQVKVGPDAYLSMSLLLRPIAEGLEGASGGRENKAYNDAKANTTVKYEKSRNGRWILATST